MLKCRASVRLVKSGTRFLSANYYSDFFRSLDQDSGIAVNDMNDAGTVVGSAYDSTRANGRAFAYSNGVLVNLNFPNAIWRQGMSSFLTLT